MPQRPRPNGAARERISKPLAGGSDADVAISTLIHDDKRRCDGCLARRDRGQLAEVRVYC
jgi:hypothetical protein